ncbi:MAG: endonuclease/exonuclease/phosphatase family protein [Cyanobacteria bacterium J06621_8]
MSKRLIKILLWGLLVLTAILAIGIQYWWDYPWELLSNFKVYYTLIAWGIAIACLLLQIWGWQLKRLLFLALALAAFNSVWLIPWYLPQSSHNQSQDFADSIRVLTFNINIQNERWDEISDSVLTLQPDVAVIVESTLKAKEKLSQRLNSKLPFIYRTAGGNLTIFSRFPLISPQSKTFNQGTILVTSLQLPQNKINLVAAHPIVPIKPNLFHRRNGLLAEIATYLQQQPQPLIFLGDLNLTPWSPYYRRFVSKTNLRNTRLGFGIEPSWLENGAYINKYAKRLASFIKLPIDHIFVRGKIKVIDCQTAKAAKSDHRMLWSDLAL